MSELNSDWRFKKKDDSTVYEGVFRGMNGLKLVSRIVEYTRRPTDVYVWDPPEAIRSNHKHGHCWQLVRPGERWFRLHWNKPAWDYEASKDYVESMIEQSLDSFDSSEQNLDSSTSCVSLMVWGFIACFGICIGIILLLILGSLIFG